MRDWTTAIGIILLIAAVIAAAIEGNRSIEQEPEPVRHETTVQWVGVIS